MNAESAFMSLAFTHVLLLKNGFALSPPQAYGLGAFGLKPISNTSPCMLARVTSTVL